jgi:hypothetical protein
MQKLSQLQIENQERLLQFVQDIDFYLDSKGAVYIPSRRLGLYNEGLEFQDIEQLMGIFKSKVNKICPNTILEYDILLDATEIWSSEVSGVKINVNTSKFAKVKNELTKKPILKNETTNEIIGNVKVIKKESKNFLQLGNEELELKGKQPVELLKILTIPSFGTHRTVDEVYSSIMATVRNKGLTYKKDEKVEKIKTVFKELQRGGKLESRLTLKWDNFEKEVWLEKIH